jgi:putative tryptophan/tyrosine transport system substrate-binding protein
MTPKPEGHMASQIERRKFLATLGGAAAAWPLMAGAQQADRVRRIGVLMGVANDAEGEARVAAFRQGLQQLGWAEGRNVLVEYRWGGGDPARLKIQAAEVAAMMPDVILAGGTTALVPMQQATRSILVGGTTALIPTHKATRSIPIVFVGSADPVGQGFVERLPRPGGNMTGFTIFEVSLVGKMLEALKQIAPVTARAVLIYSPTNSNAADYWRSLETVAPTFAVKPVAAPVRDADEIERACAALAGERNGGLLVPPDAITTARRELIIALAARYRLPAVYPFRFFVTSGGLMSYGPDTLDPYRRAAGYVDRILKGEKPADLPVQAPTKFELVINLKTANALGLEVPPTLLARADEVIE